MSSTADRGILPFRENSNTPIGRTVGLFQKKGARKTVSPAEP